MPVSPSPDPRKNQLLAALDADEYQRLLPMLEIVSLKIKDYFYYANEPIRYVYFPLDSVGSLMSPSSDGSVVEVATVGREGFVGLPVLLGVDTIPGEALCQVPGSAVRMKTEVFQREVTAGTALHKLLLRYTQALFNQTAQTATCNRRHTIEERFCRWILMTHDRIETDEFPLTQEFLADMLGVRRAGVSVVASIMKKAGFIQYRRGKITILDREGLEASSCECYHVVKLEFDRLIGRKGE